MIRRGWSMHGFDVMMTMQGYLFDRKWMLSVDTCMTIQPVLWHGRLSRIPSPLCGGHKPYPTLFIEVCNGKQKRALQEAELV